MRKYYLDTLRLMAIIFVIFIHVFVIYTFLPYYLKFDIPYPYNSYLSVFVMFMSVWLMPLLFTIAGITTFYSFKKRSVKEYIKERVLRLLIPFISAVVLLNPILAYVGMEFHYNIPISFFNYYPTYFTTITDLTGYTGGLTMGHVWFILYLFIVSIIGLVVIKLVKDRIDLSNKELSLPILILLGLIPVIAYPFLNTFVDHSIGMYVVLFLLGYYVLSQDNIMEKLENNKITLGILTAILTVIFLYIAGIVFGIVPVQPSETIFTIMMFYQVFYGWVLILFLLVFGKLFMNKTSNILQYLSGASFTIYIFHVPILIGIAYYVLQITSNVFLQIILILVLTIPITIAAYAICDRFKVTRFLFGIK